MDEQKKESFSIGRELNAIQNTTISRTTVNNILISALIIIAALLSFTDAKVSLGSIRNLTAITIFLYIVTTAVYQNQYAKGKERGKKNEEYLKISAQLTDTRKDLSNIMTVEALADYCRYYQQNELKQYRLSLLLSVNMTYAEYEPYIKKGTFAIMREPLLWSQKKAIIRCNRAKPIKMTVAKLMSDFEGGARGKIIFESGSHRERKDKTFNLIRRALTTFFSGIVVVDILMDWSWQTLIQWGIRMMPVLTALIMGESSGYSNIVDTEIAYKQGQINCLRDFQKWEASRPKEETKKEGASASS